MNYDDAMAWADALESGKFTQGEGILHNAETGSMCCLGVLCFLKTEGRRPDQLGNEFYYENKKDLLPISIANMTKMFSVKGKRRNGNIYINNRYYTNLADANDQRVSFADIAAYIRQNWADL